MAREEKQLEMFSLEEGRKKKRTTYRGWEFPISRNVLIYIILGILFMLVAVYIAGVEVGRRWKVDQIYEKYIQGEGVKNE